MIPVRLDHILSKNRYIVLYWFNHRKFIPSFDEVCVKSVYLFTIVLFLDFEQKRFRLKFLLPQDLKRWKFMSEYETKHSFVG